MAILGFSLPVPLVLVGVETFYPPDAVQTMFFPLREAHRKALGDITPSVHGLAAGLFATSGHWISQICPTRSATMSHPVAAT